MTELVALYIDALDHNHINSETTPNLHSWDEQGSLSALSTMFAFKGISPAMYAGVPPRKSGVWMDFKVRETPDPKIGDGLLALASRLPSGLPRKGAVVAYERLIRQTQVTPHIVPSNLRPYFEAHPKEAITDVRPLGEIPTIFDIFRESEISFRTVGLAGGPQQRVKKKLRKVDGYSEDVVLLKLTELDHVGHKYGPGAAEHKRALQEVDEILGNVVEATDAEFLIFSDHGMQSVDAAVDVRSLLTDDIGLLEERDFVAFFNSTCALVRWLSDDAKAEARSELDGREELEVLSEAKLDQLDVGSTKDEFADDVIATRPGTVVSPDFYRRSPPNGMHGFTSNPRGGPVGVVPQATVTDEGNLWDLAPTILDLLALDIPATWDGESLL